METEGQKFYSYTHLRHSNMPAFDEVVKLIEEQYTEGVYNFTTHNGIVIGIVEMTEEDIEAFLKGKGYQASAKLI